MQYTAVILALAGAAFAQLPGVPACAATAVQGALDAVGGPKGITDLCTDKNGVLTKLRSDLQAICSCADQNAVIGLAGRFCPQLNIPPKDCNAVPSAPVPAVPVPAVPVPSAPASSAPGSFPPVETSTLSREPVTTSEVAATSTQASVSAKPTLSANGTIATASPTATSIVVGAGSMVQAGGVAMVGAFLAALAL